MGAGRLRDRERRPAGLAVDGEAPRARSRRS